MRSILITFILSLTLAGPACASLTIVTTLPWIGSIAREIGRERVSVTTLVRPGQDPHTIEAKPSMILAARKADIIMYNGLDLEIGYLPQILESARNPRIVPGRPGNLDCSRYVRVIEKSITVDRSLGDVHPLGNPHYHFSPAAILSVAEGMASALATLDQANAGFYRENYRSFANRMSGKRKEWSAVPLKGKSYVAYHKLFEYLAGSFGFRIVTYVEQKPGIPPSAGHIESLLAGMKSARPEGILTASFYGRKEAASLSAQTGVRVITLPADVGAQPGTDDWFAFMDAVLASLR